MRIGMGYDVHRLGDDRDLIIGGVKIPYHKGLVGHSDADVLTHAVMDALLGAAALGDIGLHFPDTDGSFKNIDSFILMAKVKELIEEKGFLIENIDATIIAQAPKMRPYIDAMRRRFCETLELEATTEEHLGFTGRQEGIAAQAVCLLTGARELYSRDVMAGGCANCPGRKIQ